MKVCLFFTSQCLVLLRDVALSSKPAHTRASQCSGTSGSEKHHPTSSLSHRGQLNPTGLLGASWPRARARSLPPCPAVTAGSLPTAGPGQGKAAAPLPAAPPPPAGARTLPPRHPPPGSGRARRARPAEAAEPCPESPVSPSAHPAAGRTEGTPAALPRGSPFRPRQLQARRPRRSRPARRPR